MFALVQGGCRLCLLLLKIHVYFWNIHIFLLPKVSHTTTHI